MTRPIHEDDLLQGVTTLRSQAGHLRSLCTLRHTNEGEKRAYQLEAQSIDRVAAALEALLRDEAEQIEVTRA